MVYKICSRWFDGSTKIKYTYIIIKIIFFIDNALSRITCRCRKGDIRCSFFYLNIEICMRIGSWMDESSFYFLMRYYPLLRDGIDSFFDSCSIHIVRIWEYATSYKYSHHSYHDHKFYQSKSG